MENRLVRDGIFVEAGDGVALAGSRCRSCGRVYFPKVIRCLDCLDEALEDRPLDKKGRLFSFTVVHMASTYFKPPYAVGYVELPEGIKIFTPLKIEPDKPFKVGMEMELCTGTLWQEGDKEVVGYRFKPL